MSKSTESSSVCDGEPFEELDLSTEDTFEKVFEKKPRNKSKPRVVEKGLHIKKKPVEKSKRAKGVRGVDANRLLPQFCVGLPLLNTTLSTSSPESSM